MWPIIRDGGLMDGLAVGHFILGALLLAPRTRFAASVAQLPITAGIVAFNITMFPAGILLPVATMDVKLRDVLDCADLKRLLAQAPS